MVIEGSAITALSRPVSRPVAGLLEARGDYGLKSCLEMPHGVAGGCQTPI